MEREAIIVVAIFLILGGLNVIRPSFLLAFQIWVRIPAPELGKL